MSPKPTYPSKALSNEALEWIVRLNSGAARKSDRTAFATWRAQSAEHEAAAAEAEALWRDADNLHADPESGLIRLGGRKKPRVSRRTVLRGLAGVGVGAVGAYWASGAMRPLMADHATGVGEVGTVDLHDGTRVVLNAMSAMNVDYSPQLRRIALLQGQAYFEVMRDTARPFEVSARGATVTALGTAFDVDSRLASDRVSVFVAQNAVRVQSTFERATDSVILSAGHRVLVSGAGRIGAAVAQDPAAALAWRTGMLIAEGETLEDVIAALRTYSKGWIIIQDADVRELKVNAVLDLRTPQQSLDALAAGLPIRVMRLSNLVTVISAA
ncbi:FecR domain-containing protein [Hyphomicrobium sp. D-2]|uniref:FecR family protein n=1 Tax=Hyphomicrobium sp. D-2 TaxID=3041621 RepID=UPI002454E798|nr:FecR domain-containing protein [Hyphomicrobium sp. D-2]MDH4982027.1 FecR domain-containing protein [Hyphomicrobium sp. D-2]